MRYLRKQQIMDIGHVTWRKASYSGGNGGGCIEVGVWRRSSHSGTNGGDCIEVASTGQPLVAVRDSKDPNGPKLTLARQVWLSFLERMRNRATNAG
jgi:Domain of unknown function (DUF397)